MLTAQTAVPVPGVMFRDAWLAAGNTATRGDGVECEPVLRRQLSIAIDASTSCWWVPRSSGGAGHVLDAEVAGNMPVDGIWPSDHLAVVAELRY